MRALPDGYTLLLGQQNSHALAPGMRKAMPYDPVRDFAPITRVATAPQVLLAGSSIAAADWKQFAEYAKARPGRINYASSGHGTVSHLTSELLKQRAALDIVHVNYKGGAAATLAIASGEASVAFVPLATALPLLQGGKVRALGISSIKRFPTLPDVATLNESGLPGFEASSWFGMFAPSKIPRTLVARLNRDLTDILLAYSTQQAFLLLGAEATASTPEEFGAFVASEVVKWRKVISDAGISPQ